MSERILRSALLIQFLLLVGLSGVLRCQITSVNSERHLIVGARAAALGDAGVVDNESVNDMYYNPASLAFIARRSIDAAVSLERINNSDYDFVLVENAALPVVLDDSWTLGIGTTFSHTGKVRDEGPNGGLSYRLLATDIAASNKISRSLSLGVDVNVRYGFIDSVQLGAVSSSAGLFYTPERGVSYGIVVQGFGWGLDLSADSGKTHMKRSTLEQSFQIGVGLRFPKKADQPMLSILFATQKLFTRSELVYKGGVEVYPLTFMALRWGYWLGRHSVAAKYGGGILAGRFRLDYAVSPSALEPRFHQASISYTLGP